MQEAWISSDVAWIAGESRMSEQDLEEDEGSHRAFGPSRLEKSAEGTGNAPLNLSLGFLSPSLWPWCMPACLAPRLPLVVLTLRLMSFVIMSVRNGGGPT
jgi:hypothetical protein